jgi:GNAT superfamily N-acetyltransferase
MSINVRRLSGDEIKAEIQNLARLRIEVFRDFPYIYDGSYEYEVKYLKKYLDSSRAALIAAFDEKTIIGVASCLPLLDEELVVQKPFAEKGYDLEKVFYFGESVLQKKYRGKGLGKVFFQERENWARSFGQYDITTFCAVKRPVEHPLRPLDYRPLDEFWKTQGYIKHPELHTEFSWQDIGEKNETSKKMIFWLKRWS